jgi:hypothetical protein
VNPGMVVRGEGSPVRVVKYSHLAERSHPTPPAPTDSRPVLAGGVSRDRTAGAARDRTGSPTGVAGEASGIG